VTVAAADVQQEVESTPKGWVKLIRVVGAGVPLRNPIVITEDDVTLDFEVDGSPGSPVELRCVEAATALTIR
jgi:hypothetical protein